MIMGPGSIDSKDEEGYTKDETEQNTDSLYHFLFNPEKNLRHQLTFNSSNLVSRTIIPASTPSDFWKVEVYWLMNETTECFLTKFLKNEGNIHLTTENEVLVSSTRIRILTRWAKTIKSPTNCQGFLPGMYMLHSVRHVLSYILLKEQLRTFRLSDRDKMVTKGM